MPWISCTASRAKRGDGGAGSGHRTPPAKMPAADPEFSGKHLLRYSWIQVEDELRIAPVFSEYTDCPGCRFAFARFSHR
jgi:hypothetical protein